MAKIGLMGCGAVAMYGHLPALREAAGLELCAIYDPQPAALAAAQEKFEVPHAFTDVERFFDAGLEAVSITSPAPCHQQNVLDAARCGLPVLCEKPLAMNRAEAATMIAAMQQAGAPLFTAFCYRFSPCALQIKELVAQKAIGEVRSLRLIYNWDCHGKYEPGADGQPVMQQRRAGRMLEGGPMVDCGTHQIDLAAFWLGSPVVGYAGLGAWVDDYEAPDHIWLHLDHACGAHTVVEISYSYHHTSKAKRREFIYELIGTGGVIRYDREAQSFSMENTAGSQRFAFHSEKDFAGMYNEFAAALATGQSALLTSAEDGMRVTEIAREATDQAIERRRALHSSR